MRCRAAMYIHRAEASGNGSRFEERPESAEDALGFPNVEQRDNNMQINYHHMCIQCSRAHMILLYREVTLIPQY